MRRLIVLGLLAFAIWYGSQHGGKLFTRRPSHEAVIENTGDVAMARVRLRVDGQTLVRDAIAAGEAATLPFHVQRDGTFDLQWETSGVEHIWSGGLVPAGPMVQRHRFSVDGEAQVLYRPENK